MVFNSGVFVYFFVAVFILHWIIIRYSKNIRLLNLFLLAASYFFYGYWDWLFLGLILISTAVDYSIALFLDREEDARKRKFLLMFSVVINIGILGIFKYYDFFAKSFVVMVQSISPEAFPDGPGGILLNVILPVGISFYTFQTMSYTIDVYRRQIPAEKDVVSFALFVCFFPQLVAGPIERAGDLLSQLKESRIFKMENLAKGAWLILLGFYMKVYVADSLGPLVDMVYLPGKSVYENSPGLASGHDGFHVILASIAFSFQIYCDFAGYSNIALGSALFLGIKLTQNFNSPEMSTDPGELWRRWHITLNRWVTDYIYIPLGGSRLGKFQKHRNLLIAFVLMGLWHGANWTFLLWGFFHGSWLVLHELTKNKLRLVSENSPLVFKSSIKILKMIGVFTVFGMTATFFRAYDLNHVIELWKSIFNFPYDGHGLRGVMPAGVYAASLFKKLVFLIFLDAMSYIRKDVFWIFKSHTLVRSVIYIYMFLIIVALGVFGREVIYFAF